MIRRGDTLNLNIESLSFGGYGFAKHNGIVIFVEKGLPGQHVEAFIFKKQKKFYKARINKVLAQTNKITNARCKHFDDCGGCSFQTLDYEHQISEKYNQIIDLFSHIGRLKKINRTVVINKKPAPNHIIGAE